MNKRDLELVLEWCNEQRAKRGLKPRKKIFKGLARNHCKCPIARTLGKAEVGRITFKWKGSIYQRDMPPVVREFVSEFDRGALLQYMGRAV